LDDGIGSECSKGYLSEKWRKPEEQGKCSQSNKHATANVSGSVLDQAWAKGPGNVEKTR
jgi:hypothetical protein